MADDLCAFPFAVGLSRAARSIVRRNLWASWASVGISLPVAVLVHEISEFVVIGSGLRLLRAPSEGAAA